MKYLHTMVRVADLDESLAFYSTLGLSLGRSHRIAQSEGPFMFVFNDIQVSCETK